MKVPLPKIIIIFFLIENEKKAYLYFNYITELTSLAIARFVELVETEKCIYTNSATREGDPEAFDCTILKKYSLFV